MAKQLTIPFDGKNYTLEITRRTVVWLEDDGFNANDVDNKPMSSVYHLFKSAFRKHHPNISEELVWDIFEAQEDLQTLSNDLGEMYKQAYITTDPEGEQKRTKKE